MRIKTLHLTNAFHEQSGGIATFYRSLLQEANRRRQSLCLVVPGSHDRVEQVGEHGRIYFVRAPAAPLNHSYRVLYPSQFLFFSGRIQEILQAERPDVVEICDKYNLNYLGAVLRLRLLPGIDFRPLVLGLSCERMDDNFATYLRDGPLQRAFCRWYMRWIYFPFFDHHIAVSEHTAEELVAAARGHAVPRGLWVRPMGVDVQGFSSADRSPALRKELCASVGADEDARLLLYVGRLAPEKNLGLLLDTMSELASSGGNWQLLLAGDGIERTRMAEQAARIAPGRVHFLGHIADRSRLARLYANCDVFVHPNPREPFGIAPLEAMASGLPLVAPDSGGITTFANAGNAWLTAPRPGDFAQAVRTVFSNPEVRRMRVQAATETAQARSWESATSAYLSLYEELHSLARGAGTMNEAEPYFVSTAATKSGNALIGACASLAAGVFRMVERAHRPSPPAQAQPVRAQAEPAAVPSSE